MRETGHILIGIAGGTGSGKTLVANRLVKELGSSRVVTLELDSYYRDLSHLDLEARSAVNFDHPDAFDIDLLVDHLERLMRGEAVDVPVYDYARHNRKADTIPVSDHAIVVLEGILVFYFKRLRDLMNIKIYVDTPDDIRLLRRLRRDIVERDRTVEAVLEQYETSVRPMHMTFVEPTKRHADIIIPRGGENRIAIDIVKAKIDHLLRAFTERGGSSAS